MKEEMIQRKMRQFSEECPICKILIKGFSESQVKYALKTHLKQKHKGEKIKWIKLIGSRML